MLALVVIMLAPLYLAAILLYFGVFPSLEYSLPAFVAMAWIGGTALLLTRPVRWGRRLSFAMMFLLGTLGPIWIGGASSETALVRERFAKQELIKQGLTDGTFAACRDVVGSTKEAIGRVQIPKGVVVIQEWSEGGDFRVDLRPNLPRRLQTIEGDTPVIVFIAMLEETTVVGRYSVSGAVAMSTTAKVCVVEWPSKRVLGKLVSGSSPVSERPVSSDIGSGLSSRQIAVDWIRELTADAR